MIANGNALRQNAIECKDNSEGGEPIEGAEEGVDCEIGCKTPMDI
jgi:hypothetical protein